MTPPVAPPSSGWSLLQRLGFRYLFLHWILYAFTDPQGNPLVSLLGAFKFGLDKIAGAGRSWNWFDADLSHWLTSTSKGVKSLQGAHLDVKDGVVGDDHGWVLKFTSWLSEKSGAFNDGEPLFEVFHQRTGSGDTMHDLVKLCCIVVFAGLLTIAWSLLDRSRSYPRLGRWLHLGARWYVALQMLGYGMAKFYGTTQFPEPGIMALTREVGDHSPMGMVWTFMGASPPYKYLSGAGELLGFALLLHRRTALLGCFVTAGVMANVCALNFLCGVPVKLFSGHLLLIAMFLMVPYANRLWALFVSNQPSGPVDLRVVSSRWLGWLLLGLGWLWAIGVAWQGHESRVKRYEDPVYAKYIQMPELFGLWRVEKMQLDGVEVPMSDSSRWKYLAIDRRNIAWGKTLTGRMIMFNLTEDLGANEITLAPRSGSDGTEVWKIERSTVTRKRRHPAPRTRQEMLTPIDTEVPAIVFRGNWRGKAIELHTVKKRFRLHDKFRLVREFPR